jgi:hypothetical protein
MSKKTKTEYPSVLIVIPTYEGRDLLEEHLPSVVKTDYPNYDIVVVDNASNDGTVKFLQSKYPEIKIIKNNRNLGFGRANNKAFRKYPDYEFYALLNNDMDVEPDWLSKLVKTISEDSRIAAVGPKILYSFKVDGRQVVNSAGMYVNKNYLGMDRYCGLPNSEEYNVQEEVSALSGGAVVLKREALEDVGYFNPLMYFYYEDVDLSLRLRDSKWKLIYNGKAVVYHDHMATAKSWKKFRRTFFSNLNRLISIAQRRGLLVAMFELIRTPLHWAYCKITGKVYRDELMKEFED